MIPGGGGFWPLEEVSNEGGIHQSIERHIALFNETHREHIRLFFPEIEELTRSELWHLESLTERELGKTILEIYRSVHMEL